LRRVAAADNYLSDLRPAYHALRPLRFVLHSTCEPVLSYLEDLMQNVACRATAADPASRIGEQVAAAGAHFGIEITDDGQNARVFDERGAAVATERLLASLAGEIGEACTVTADALRTLTLLLVLLSRDDLPLSTVLDRAAVKK
jgi:hypothetical protein